MIKSLNVVSNLTNETLNHCNIECRLYTVGQFIEASLDPAQWITFVLTSSEYKLLKDTDAFMLTKNKICILLFSPEEKLEDAPSGIHFFAKLPQIAGPGFSAMIHGILQSAAEKCDHGSQMTQVKQKLAWESKKLKQLNEIGKSLSSIADPYVLLNLILKKSRELTNADAGSICVVRYDSDDNAHELIYSYFQNDTLNQDMKVNLKLPASKKSLAGYVAITGECLQIEDTYKIPEEKDYKFNSDVDKSTGYRTKSMLIHPMIDNESRILGVVQLLNKKSHDYQQLPDGKLNIEQIEEFTSEDVEIIHSLTSQAAICLKNTTLIQEIQDLFEGFVNASVTAIEQRDPTTSGHSVRVAMMTVELAKVVSAQTDGPYKHICYTPQELQELRYSGLLHDFGKLNVREEVLVKAKKLYPHQMEVLRARFDYILRDAKARIVEKKIQMIEDMGWDMAKAHFSALDEELKSTVDEIEDILYFIIESNNPTPMEEGNFQRLLTIAKLEYPDPYNAAKPYLTEREVEALSIRKGTLTSEERREIESHVTYSFSFLSKIPWPRGYKQVPAIAYGHHEWLSGDGYPNQLNIDEILLQSKMMAIADIYDALTASDRPYKKAIPVDRALMILGFEVKDGHLDPYLVDLFKQNEVYRVAENY